MTSTEHGAARDALTEEFALLTSYRVADRAGYTGAAAMSPLSRWQRDGRVFAVPVGVGARYPDFQFSTVGGPRPGVAAIIKAAAGAVTGWGLALWFIAPNDELGGARPVDVLDGPDQSRAELAMTRLAAALS